MVNRNVILLSLASFFTDSATAMVVSVLPIYVVFHLGANYNQLGVIVGTATLVSYLLRVIFGLWSDRLGISKPFLLVGYGLSAVAKPLFAFTDDWKEVAFLRGIDRLGKAIRSAPRDRLLSMSGDSGKTTQGRIFGFHKTFDVAGEFLGASIALLFLTLLGNTTEVYRQLFLMSAIPGLLAVVTVAFVKDIKTAPKSKFTLSEGDKKLLFPVLLMGSVPLFVWTLPFFSTVAVDYRYIEESIIPLAYLLTQGVQVVFGYPVGCLIDKWGTEKVFLISLLSAAVGLYLLIIGGVWLAFPLLGVHMVSFFTAARSFIGQMATDRGTVFGIFYTTYGVTGAIGSLIVGFLINRFGVIPAALYTIGGLFIVSMLTPWVIGRVNNPA